MQSVAFYFLASALAVTYGWQPMPDGSESYEYVVQLDKELLTRLERGESIPISTDIPEDIQPIRRIRLVVGDEDLPRRKLVTALKPEQQEASTDVVRGQYADSAPRYANQPILPADSASNQILPRAREVENSVNALGDALQRTAREARNAAETQILPRANQILPRSSGDILPKNSTARISNTSQNTNASNDAAIRELFAEPAGRKQNNVQVADQRNATGGRYPSDNSANAAPILPRNNNGNMSTAGNNSTISPPNNGNGARYDRGNQFANPQSEPVAPRTVSNGENTPRIQAPWPEDNKFQDSPLAEEYKNRNGRYATSNNMSPPNGQSNLGSRPNRDNLAQVPRQQDMNSSELQLRDPRGFQEPTRDSNPSGVPSIRKNMLEAPADRELRMASDGRAAMPASYSEPREVLQENHNNVSPTSNPVTTVASQSPTVEQPSQTPSSSNPNAQAFPLVVAWVLLFGSGGGNVYMLWNYLDIRSKYRDLVRSAGRKLGRRYLDDRYGDRDEYDD